MELDIWKNQVFNWNQALRESRSVLESFRNQYYGKRCFIIGNGPSLNHVDWSLLKDEYTFGANRIYLLFDKMGFVPSFYTCVDSLAITQSIDEIKKIKTPKFISESHIQLLAGFGEIGFLRSLYKPKFHKDLTQGVYEGYTVTFVSLQVAYFMGFREVILIGVDHNYVFEGNPNQEVVSLGDDVNHFHPDYLPKGYRWKTPNLAVVEQAYSLAKSAFEEDGRIILDGTINGKLTIFPKVNYLDIFKFKNQLTRKKDLSRKYHRIIDDQSVDSDRFFYKVSAIVSTYNSEKYLSQCLDDLENQTIAASLEIIVVISGSEQGEEKIVLEYQKKYPNIKYICTAQRESIYQAWNRAIKLASGEYITNANTDDCHCSDAFEKLSKALDENQNCALVYADQNDLSETANGDFEIIGVRRRGIFSVSRLYRECCVGSQPMWRRAIHNELGYFDESFFTAGDYEFWLRIAQKYPFFYVNEVLGGRLVRQDSLEFEGQGITSAFETAILRKSYQYACVHDIPILISGLSCHPIFSDWCEINLLKRNTRLRLTNTQASDINYVNDWRENGIRPILSVIIATHNREEDLFTCLRQLNFQVNKNFEVIVVNNGKEINRFIEKPLGMNYGLCIIQMRANYGPSLGRNIGSQYARGDYLAMLDDDAIAQDDWGQNIISHFEEQEHVVAIRGRIKPKKQTMGRFLHPNFDLGDVPLPNMTSSEANIAFRRLMFMDVGGFDNNFYYLEGIEISYRLWLESGKRLNSIMYYPDIVVFHDYSEDPDHLLLARIHVTESKRFLIKKWTEIEKYIIFNWNFLPMNQRPDDFSWFMDQFEFCYSNNNFGDAIEFGMQAMQAMPFEIKPYQRVADSYFCIGEIEKSAVAYEIILDILETKLQITHQNTTLNELKQGYTSMALKLAYLYFKNELKEQASKMLKKLDENPDICFWDDENRKRRVQILALLG